MEIPAAIRKGYTRWQASGLHLLISAVIAAAVLWIMLAAWYPGPLFEVQGGMGLLFILVVVDVVIGPLVTLIIFKSGKPGLRFDLSVIAALQVAALMYGSYVVFQARPAFLVLVTGQFEVVNVADLDPRWLTEARRPEFRTFSLTGPVLVVSEQPTDEQERQAIILSAVSGERDVQHYPRYYVPYAERTRETLATGQSIDSVRVREPNTAAAIERYLADSGHKSEEVLHFPMRARNGWIAVLVDARSGEVVKMLLVPDL